MFPGPCAQGPGNIEAYNTAAPAGGGGKLQEEPAG